MPRRRLVALVTLAGLALAGGWLLRSRLGLSFDPSVLRDTVAEFGLWGPLAMVAMVAFRPFIGIPSQVLLIGAGLAFGTVAGGVYGALGITLSGLMVFGGARWAGREAVLRRIPPRLRPAFDAAGTRLGAGVLAAATAYPFGPITAYHTLAGVTGMAVPAFTAALILGALVRAFVYTFFGSSLVEGSIAAVGAASAVLGLALALPLCFGRSRGWVAQMLRPPARVSPRPRPGPGRSGPSPP